MKKRRVSEKRIVDVLVSDLRKRCLVAREVKHYEKRIDVAALPFLCDDLVTYEAKIADWTRALSQAIVNLAAGERAYIAMYKKNIHRVPMETLVAYGIGLVSVGSKWGEVEEILEAKSSPYLNRLASQRIRQQIEPKV